MQLDAAAPVQGRVDGKAEAAPAPRGDREGQGPEPEQRGRDGREEDGGPQEALVLGLLGDGLAGGRPWREAYGRPLQG